MLMVKVVGILSGAQNIAIKFKKEYNKNLCSIALIESAKKAEVEIFELEVQPEQGM